MEDDSLQQPQSKGKKRKQQKKKPQIEVANSDSESESEEEDESPVSGSEAEDDEDDEEIDSEGILHIDIIRIPYLRMIQRRIRFALEQRVNVANCRHEIPKK